MDVFPFVESVHENVSSPIEVWRTSSV